MLSNEARRATVRRLIAESYTVVLERLGPAAHATDEITALNDEWEDVLREAKQQACRHVAKQIERATVDG